MATDNEQATFNARLNQFHRDQRSNQSSNQQQQPQVNTLYATTDVDDRPLLSGPWMESDPSAQVHQVHQDPWATLQQEGPTV